ncbi:MAG: tRNA dihydrouridine synthase DusB [Chlamydiales bacterium]|nr:tRNA dihydrouridine synthase DusB [Chlamydiales bacterium]
MTVPHEPIQLGKLTLPNRVIYSPLAGCSDLPFRQMAAQYKPGLVYCEMVKLEPLVRGDPTTFHLLDYTAGMHPIGAQLCGSKANLAGQAARIIEDLGFDIVDLNCGCPVDKVTKDGSGSGMLKTPQLIGELISNMVAAVDIPVTVKIRAGWDEQNINAAEITKIAEEAGAVAIAIHGRTRAQAYRGPANWDYIKQCREAATTIKVFGNGDVFSADAALRMFAYTGCDAILASRGTMGAPWIAEDIIKASLGQEVPVRTIEDYRQALLQHFLYQVAYESGQKALVSMRRVGCWYIKSSHGTREFRHKCSRAQSIEEVRQLILEFPFEAGDVVNAEAAEEESVTA